MSLAFSTAEPLVEHHQIEVFRSGGSIAGRGLKRFGARANQVRTSGAHRRTYVFAEKNEKKVDRIFMLLASEPSTMAGRPGRF